MERGGLCIWLLCGSVLEGTVSCDVAKGGQFRKEREEGEGTRTVLG